MTIRTVILSSALLLASVPAYAQGQGQGQGSPPPNTQQLAAQLAALQARVAKLEGNIVASDLVGTYSLLVMGTSMSAFHPAPPGTPPVLANISTGTNAGTLALNADGTGTANIVRCDGAVLTPANGSVTGTNDDCATQPTTGLTWEYANGVVSITLLDSNGQPDHNGALPFTVALGGRLFILGDSPFHPSDPSSDHLIFIATRLQ